MSSKENEELSLSGSMDRQLMRFAIWPLLENLLNYIVTTTALYIATHMATSPQEEIAYADGMGAVAYIAWFGLLLQSAICMGSSTIVARMTGARDAKTANHAASQGILLGAIAGAISCALILVFLNYTITHLLKLDPLAQEFAQKYMCFMAFSYPISGAVMACNSALRGSGDTRTPFFVMLVVDVSNALIAMLLVWGPSRLGFGWGPVGLGAAAIFGYSLGLLLLCGVFVRTYFKNAKQFVVGHLVPSFRLMIPDWTMQWRLLRIGMPQAIEMVGIFAIQFYVISIISRMSMTGALGAHTITVRTEGLAYMPGFAVGAAVSVLVGQYLGRQEPEKAKQAVLVALKYSVIIMSSMGILFIFVPELFVGIFTPEGNSLMEQSSILLRIAGFSEPFFAACLALKFALRGAGDTTRVMIWSYLSTGIFRVVCIALWSGLANSGQLPAVNLPGIWILFGIDLLVQTIIFWRIYKKGKWVGLQV